jgi:ABC-2 type transport system ATP-binding protein
MLTLEHLTKRYGALTALDGVSLRIEAGEFFGLLGPNGAGKSTLMALVSGLRAADAGELRLDGRPLAGGAPDTVGAIGLVPQSVALYEDLSADENLRVFGRLFGLRGGALAARVTECLEAVQLAERRRDAVKTFSGGMQRRLNLAASLLHRPKLLLCDEPTVGVDPQSRNAIFDLLRRLNREGMTIIYSTHYMEEATRLCSRIGIIDHGKILALGMLDELLTRLPFTEVVNFPRTTETAPAAAALRGFGELVEAGDQCSLRLGAQARLSQVFAAAEAAGVPDRLFSLKRPTLEDLFLHLTGKSLRE